MEVAETLPEPINGDFTDKSIVSITQFDRDSVEQLFDEADAMVEMVADQGRDDLLADKMVANLFYQPSTRTFASFEAAAKRLGAGTIATQGVEYSSISKDETDEDTALTIERYVDTIVLRHPEQGSVAKAASVTEIPIINAGDGIGEHPTQALLDLYTIEEELGAAENLTVTMVGDLKYGRTVHSLARLLGLYNVRLNYVAPPELAMPETITNEISSSNIEQHSTANLHEVISESDVVYMTRIQKEHFSSLEEYERYKGAYVVDLDTMKHAKQEMILMHPLPRVDEIHPGVDDDPRAVYFDQVENGMYIRMSLLALVNGYSIS